MRSEYVLTVHDMDGKEKYVMPVENNTFPLTEFICDSVIFTSPKKARDYIVEHEEHFKRNYVKVIYISKLLTSGDRPKDGSSFKVCVNIPIKNYFKRSALFDEDKDSESSKHTRLAKPTKTYPFELTNEGLEFLVTVLVDKSVHNPKVYTILNLSYELSLYTNINRADSVNLIKSRQNELNRLSLKKEVNKLAEYFIEKYK